MTKFSIYLSFTVRYNYTKIGRFMPILSMTIVLSCFYLFISHFENFSTWISPCLPFAVNAMLNLSINYYHYHYYYYYYYYYYSFFFKRINCKSDFNSFFNKIVYYFLLIQRLGSENTSWVVTRFSNNQFIIKIYYYYYYHYLLLLLLSFIINIW